ncbi:hypothetical protein Ancab_025334, partial [Ancistrocladus abbreviatus]
NNTKFRRLLHQPTLDLHQGRTFSAILNSVNSEYRRAIPMHIDHAQMSSRCLNAEAPINSVGINSLFYSASDTTEFI